MRTPIDRLRHHLLVSLGVAPGLLVACGVSEPTGEDGGVTTNPSSSSSADVDDGTSSSGSVPGNPTSGTTSVPGDDDGDGDPDGGMKLDLPPEPDLPPPLADCTLTLVDPGVLDEFPECPIVLGDNAPCWDNLYWACVELEPGLTCDEVCPNGDCIGDWTTCTGDMVYDWPADVCGPYERDGMCCMLGDVAELCGVDGRPFVVDGVARRARLHRVAAAIEHDDALAERVRAHWAEVARAEHASVASFAQFGAQLLALGAPPALVRDALAAADDEVRHAVFALARAGELAGAQLAFGSLDTRGAVVGTSLRAIVRACVRDGCIGETLAALELLTVAQHCPDPELRAALLAIADDESRHAALAWRFVQWALRSNPGLAADVHAALDIPVGTIEPESLSTDERRALRAHGVLPTDERHSLARTALRELIEPCRAALLGQGQAISV